MIKTLRIERFKGFQDESLAFRRLTVLTGLNGSGKTTVIHALMLAKQAMNSETVMLNGHFGLHLGEAMDVLHTRAGATSLALTVETDVGGRTWDLEIPEERSLYLKVLELAQGSDFGFPTPIEYLCADRHGPRDSLPASSADANGLGVGVQGEYTAQVLAMQERHKVPASRQLDAMSPAQGLLRPQTEAWMGQILGLDAPLQLAAEWFPGTTVTRLQYRLPGAFNEWTRPHNMGFGVSYVLPIVVAGLLAPVDSLLIVENPEAHLHPAGQSEMGAFLARVAGSGVQVLVETHSDHVLNGIRRATLGDGRFLLPADVVVQFFRGGKGVEAIDIGNVGELSSWPKGFFDQIERDLAVIARARRSRS